MDQGQQRTMIADAPWRARDLAVLWHPCTQMREHPGTLPLVPIARGEGAWLIGQDGRRYLDAVSSWWTNLFGHAEPRIAEAIATQARTLEQVILAGRAGMEEARATATLVHGEAPLRIVADAAVERAVGGTYQVDEPGPGQFRAHAQTLARNRSQ